MHIRNNDLIGIIAIFVLLIGAPNWGIAQTANPAETATPDEPPMKSVESEKPASSPAELVPPVDVAAHFKTKKRARWGVLLRGRYMFIPRKVFELFASRVSSGLHQPAIGLEVVRRTRNFDIAFGLEYARLELKDGIWIEDGDSIPENVVDFVEYDNFAWLAAEVNLIWHYKLNKRVALRYGIGAGLGLRLGAVLRTDYECTGTTVDTCSQQPDAEEVRSRNVGIPPVFPVINVLGGFQFWPSDKIAINIEAGLHSALYSGISAGYFF